MTSLPNWMQNNDRGFLAGAQFGAGVVRSGEEIRASRQRQEMERELQPLRVQQARTANDIARQRFDLQAALGPLQIKGAELGNEVAAAQLLSTNLGIDMKQAQLADQTKIENAQANWELGDPTEPTGLTPAGQAQWITWKANTDAGRAIVQNEAAKKESAIKLIDAETRLIQAGYTGATRQTDKDGKQAMLPDPELVAKGFAEVQSESFQKPVTSEINGQTFYKSGPNSWSLMPSSTDSPDTVDIEGVTYIRTGPNSWTAQKAAKPERPYSFTEKDEKTGKSTTIRMTEEEYLQKQLDETPKDTVEGRAKRLQLLSTLDKLKGRSKPKDKRVIVEKDGKRYRLPSSQLKDAESQGYKLVP